jgi:small subunit ribosomal protein S11
VGASCLIFLTITFILTIKMAKTQQASAKTVAKKRIVKIDTHGDVHINASFNNIIISITNKAGQVISWSSAGKMGFRGSKKNTPYAAQVAAQDCAKVASDAGMKKADVFVKGPGSGREGAIRAMNNSGIEVTSIKDVTPMPHNGCRPPKKRRV